MKCLVFLLFAGVATCAPNPTTPPPVQQHIEIVVHNAPLVKVYDRVFSVIDVKKRMDMTLLEKDPRSFEYAPARYQYYVNSWRQVLDDMVNEYLMLLDAKEMKIEIPEPNLKEEINKRFGPNVVATISRLGLTPKEASEFVKNEQLVKTIAWYKIWVKVFHDVTPSKLHESYVAYVKSNPPEEKWTYQVLTLKPSKADKLEEESKFLQNLVQTVKTKDLAELKVDLETALPESSVTVSSAITLSEKEIAPNIKGLLSSIGINMISSPILQVVKNSDVNACKVYRLLDHAKAVPPSFSTMKDQLENELLMQKSRKFQAEYVRYLKEHFCFEELAISKAHADFEPFQIKVS
ncbi:MAG: hypothetical protein A3F09_03435 [Chlamydiae bacterium RIFCSPHIGHO2_12_FULL_49_11]|nr:MAG: hypothetical protein A3F09_03435 [Chlamydiae bacterium RIFCSPHIGHO2_12_FULL_49_11]